MGSGSAITTTAIALASTICFALVFMGIGLAVVLSLIPTYTTTSDLSVSGERYCINNYLFNVTLNASSTSTIAVNSAASDNILLSLACTRVLRSYSSDSTISACLISNCNFTTGVSIPANTPRSTNAVCYVVVYYSSRCFGQGATSGVNNTIYSSGNSACRRQRLSAINGALGSSSTQFTNVPTLTVSGTVYSVVGIYSQTFSAYGQNGSYYCGAISQSAIAPAVSAQASG